MPNEIYTLRWATIDDASACALIVDDWIEKTVDMPRLKNGRYATSF